MSILFTDLDNTLIYSHRREIGEDKIAIEHLGERKQSYMTRFTFDFLMTCKWLNVIPVTARTEKQFNRLEFPDGFGIRYAIVCNGGKLLIDNKEDMKWTNETNEITRVSYDSLDDATNLLERVCGNVDVHKPEAYMRYAKCSDPETVYATLSKMVDAERVTIQRDDRKIYLFASAVTKGNAIKRFMKAYGQDIVVAAGDGMSDISMLEKADYAFPGKDIYKMIKNKNKIRINEKVISDVMFSHINEMRIKGII